MKKRLFAGLLALCMIFNMLPATAFAEEITTEPVVTEAVCEAKEDCAAETHIETCAKYPAPVVVCEAKEDCAAETHIEGCPANEVYVECSTEGCELVEGHEGECTGSITYETQQEYVANVGGKEYTTFVEAVKEAEIGDTIQLLKDTSLDENVVLNNVELSIEGNYTLTLNASLKVEGISTINISCGLAGNGDIWFEDGAIIKDSTINGGVFVAGNVTFRGDNTVGMIYDYGDLTDYYNTKAPMEWTVEEGASLKITDKARYGLGYGDEVTVYGSIENALTARDALTDEDVSFFTHGIVAQESKGWDQSSSFTVKDAYVVIGSNNSFGNKSGNYGGTYTFDFDNVVLDGSRITFYEAPSTTEFNFNDSDVKIGTFMTNDQDSKFSLVNTKLVSTTTTNGTDEGNYNAGSLELKKSSITYSAPLRNNGEIKLDAASSVTAPSVTGNGKFVIDVKDWTKVVKVVEGDLSTFNGTIELANNTDDKLKYEIKDDGLYIEVGFVAKIGSQGYTTFAKALEVAQPGETVKLLVDVVLEDTINITKSIILDGNGCKFIPADMTKTYNSVIMAGDSSWGDDHGETITLKNLNMSGWKTNYGVVRAQGVTFNVENCEMSDNSVSNEAYGVLSLNFTDATVINSKFENNTSRAIDINYNVDDNEYTNAVVTIDGCEFNNNKSTGAGIVVRNDGEQLVVKDSRFTNNTVNTNGNAATLYAGWGEEDSVTGCTFSGNTVTTSHATTKRFASAIFCDGCTATGNLFTNNTATRNGKSISTIVAIGAYYGDADINSNYWCDGDAPVEGKDYTIEFSEDVDIQDYYADEALTNKLKIEAVAKIGEKEYANLQKAINAANDGDTITLLTDITVESNLSDAAKGLYNIEKDDKITLDLNGKTINVTDNSKGNFIVFYNYGEFTIKNGTVNLTATNNRKWDAQSTIVLNRGGVLNVESGKYVHNGGTDMAITIDDSGNSFGDAEMYVKGGEITSTYTAIRMRMANTSLNGNPGNGTVFLEVTDGTISGGKRGIWGQITNASTDELGALSVTGGTVKGATDAIRIDEDDSKNIDIKILGDAKINGSLAGDEEDFVISGGYFTQTPPSKYIAEGLVANLETNVKDGVTYLYVIGEKIQGEPEKAITPAEPKVNSTVNTSGLTQAQKEAVNEVVEDIVNSSQSTSFESVLPEAADIITDMQDEEHTEVVKQFNEELKDVISTPVEAEKLTIHVRPYLDVQVEDVKLPEEGSAPEVKLDITMMYDIVASTEKEAEKIVTAEEKEEGETVNAVVTDSGELTVEKGTEVEITVPLPEIFDPDDVIVVKHIKDDGTVYYYDAIVNDDDTITFINPNGFSTFIITRDSRNATVEYSMPDGTVESVSYAVRDITSTSLRTADKDGYIFKGWNFGNVADGPYSGAMTEELLTKLSEAFTNNGSAPIVATPVFEEAPASSGGSSSNDSIAEEEKTEKPVQTDSVGKETVEDGKDELGTLIGDSYGLYKLALSVKLEGELDKATNIKIKADGVTKADSVIILQKTADGWKAVPAEAGDGYVIGKFTSLSEVLVFVNENGEAEAAQEPELVEVAMVSKPASTGDSANILAYAGMVTLAAAGLTVLFLRKRRA